MKNKIILIVALIGLSLGFEQKSQANPINALTMQLNSSFPSIVTDLHDNSTLIPDTAEYIIHSGDAVWFDLSRTSQSNDPWFLVFRYYDNSGNPGPYTYLWIPSGYRSGLWDIVLDNWNNITATPGDFN